MKRKIIMFSLMCLTCFVLGGCENKSDCIEVWNESGWVFDNIEIPIKYGYFYDRHEKFTADENTIGVTIYFTNYDEW